LLETTSSALGLDVTSHLGAEDEQPHSAAATKLRQNGYEVGRWWSRKFLGEYFPAINRENPSLQKFLRSHGWNPS